MGQWLCLLADACPHQSGRHFALAVLHSKVWFLLRLAWDKPWGGGVGRSKSALEAGVAGEHVGVGGWGDRVAGEQVGVCLGAVGVHSCWVKLVPAQAPFAVGIPNPMAPTKAAKRASTQGTSKTKRARASRDVEAQCQQIADALCTATVFPASALTMLSACLVPAIGAFKEDRHALQTQVVTWIGEALVGIEANLDKTVLDANSNLEATQADSGLQEAAVTEQDTTLKGLVEAAEAASTALEEAKNALADACSKLSKAGEEETTGASEIEAAISRKVEVEDLIKGSFEELKAAPAKKKAMESFLSKAKKENVEEGLLKAAPVSFAKTAESRTEFDCLVLTKIGEDLQQRVAELNETITKGDVSKAQLRSAVEAADQAVSFAAAKLTAKTGESSEALAAAKAGEKAVKEARKAHKGSRPAVKEAEAAVKAASTGARRFKSGPLAIYAELRDRAAPVLDPAEPQESAEAQEPAMAA